MKRSTVRQSEGGLFAQQLARAVQQRGRLDSVYQALSDHWTVILQRLYPVWSVVGPGLSNPGHIELASRTVYLDSDALLGSREEILAGTVAPLAVLATFGVGIHEVLHAKHTKQWVNQRDGELVESGESALVQLAEDRRLLEEPRMEANGVREFEETTRRGKFVRRALTAAVSEVILPVFQQALTIEALLTKSLSRDTCGRSMVYLKARTHYGVCDPATLGTLQAIWGQTLGAGDVAKLDDLFARLIWAPDGENDTLDRYAAEYRAIIGPPPPQTSPAGAGGGERGDSGQGQQDADGNAGGGEQDETEAGDKERSEAGSEGEPTDGDRGDQASPKSLGAALKDSIDQQREGELLQLDEDLDLQELLKGATAPAAKDGGRGTGAPTGRMPRRGVNRPPMSDEMQMARQYARRMHQARQVGLKTIEKRTPGGRFNARSHMRAHAQRISGAPVTSHPWEITKTVQAPLQEPHVGIVIDTSGSMSGYQYALGPIAWVLSTGLRDFGGRCAVALFGNGTELLSDGSKPLTLVPGIKTGGGTAFGGDAITMCAEHLELENPLRPRFMYVISDGGWMDCEAGVAKINELRDLGVPTIHISIGMAPLSVEATSVVVVRDPADALDVIANRTIEALRALRRRR